MRASLLESQRRFRQQVPVTISTEIQVQITLNKASPLSITLLGMENSPLLSFPGSVPASITMNEAFHGLLFTLQLLHTASYSSQDNLICLWGVALVGMGQGSRSGVEEGCKKQQEIPLANIGRGTRSASSGAPV
ncbi:unnamed protein product [Caretta caretta]